MLNQLNAQLRRELAQIETENIDSIINSHFEAEKLKTYLFDSLQNLKTIEDWLVTYSRQLDAMGADVHLVERRNKALQNESDQQKLLLSEIEGLIADLKLPGYVLEVLKNEPLEFAEGIKLCEEATERLMDSISNKFQAVEIADMKAVKERIVLFQSYANDFAERLSLFLQNLFKSQSDAYLFDVDRLCKRGNLKLYGHEAFEEKIYKFKKLLLWLKSVDARKHNELQIKYTQEIGRVYKHEIHELFEQLRQHHVQKIHAADQSYLFVAASSVSSTATSVISSGAKNVLKSAQVVRGLNLGAKTRLTELQVSDKKVDKTSTLTSSVMSFEVSADEKISPEALFGDALNMVLPIITKEQNFVLELFALKSIEKANSAMELNKPQPNKDPKLVRRIQEMMDELFRNIPEEFMSLLDVGVKHDQSVSLGMLSRLEEYTLTEESSFWINNLTNIIQKRLVSDEQQKIIEDTKVNSKKRSGVLPIFRTFPNFIDRMESYVEPEAASTRQLLNSSYDRIAKMLFEALDAVVKDVGNDKVNDDKEHVNVHIMLVENMHFIIAEIRARKLSDLDNYVKLAKNIYEINLVSYCRVVLRKPLGKLLEFFEGVEQILKTQKEEEVSFTIHYSKPVAKELFKKYPGKEIRKGLEVLYKRVDKHYSEDGEGSGQLLQVVWRGIQEEVVVSLRRFEELVMKCYPGSGIRLEFSIEEIVGYFSTMSLD